MQVEGVKWLHSYVVADRTYCIYEAPSVVRDHACRLPSANTALQTSSEARFADVLPNQQ